MKGIMIASIIKKRMKKTKWFLGTGIVMALLVVVALFTRKPTQATAAEAAGETYKLAQIGTTEYSSYSSNVLESTDGTSYTVITKDGKIATIDNTVAKYDHVGTVTSSTSYNVVAVYNSENKAKFVTYTGKEYGVSDFHERIAFTSNKTTGIYAGSFFTQDGNAVVVYSKTGEKLATYTTEANTNVDTAICYPDKTAYVLWDSANRVRKLISVDKSGTVKEITSGYNFETVNESVVCAVKYTDKTNREYLYFNSNLEEITAEEAKALLGSTSSTTKPTNGSGSISSSSITLEDGYVPTYKYEYDRFTLYVGYKAGEGYNKLSAYFSPSGKMLANNVYKVLPDYEMVVTCELKDNSRVYKLYKLLKADETLNVEYYTESQTIVANEEVVSASTVIETNEDGSVTTEIALDDVDGSREVVEIAAAPGVIPADAKMNLSKIKAGEKYESAKKAVESIAAKVTVFEIDLFNTENVKIQPNGNIKFTLDVPTGYASEKVSVYRVEADGTYTKMESKVVDGKVEFVTNHFSTYVITEDMDTSGSSVETGDSTPITFYLIAALVAFSLLCVVSKKKIVK